jgi:hypothetical protein
VCKMQFKVLPCRLRASLFLPHPPCNRGSCISSPPNNSHRDVAGTRAARCHNGKAEAVVLRAPRRIAQPQLEKRRLCAAPRREGPCGKSQLCRVRTRRKIQVRRQPATRPSVPAAGARASTSRLGAILPAGRGLMPECSNVDSCTLRPDHECLHSEIRMHVSCDMHAGT